MKKLIKSLLAIMFLSLFTSSTLALANEKDNLEEQIESIRFQRDEMRDLIKKGDKKGIERYELQTENLSDIQIENLENYQDYAERIIDFNDEQEEKSKKGFDLYTFQVWYGFAIVGLVVFYILGIGIKLLIRRW